MPPSHDHDPEFDADRPAFFAALAHADIDYEALKTALHRVGAPAPSAGGRAMRHRIMQALSAGRPMTYIIDVEASIGMAAEENRWSKYRHSRANGAGHTEALAKMQAPAKASVEAPVDDLTVALAPTDSQVETCKTLGIPVPASQAVASKVIEAHAFERQQPKLRLVPNRPPEPVVRYHKAGQKPIPDSLACIEAALDGGYLDGLCGVRGFRACRVAA